MNYRKAFLIILSLLSVFNQALASDLVNNTFIQSNINRSNFEPGGQHHLFGSSRGSVSDREGSINVIPLHEQKMGNLQLDNVIIQGNISYNTRFSNHHHYEHEPFSSSESQSKTSEQGSVNNGFTVLQMHWNGTEVHPADGYDGPQGSGYPAPTGARDEYYYSISGNAHRISIKLDDNSSTSERIWDRLVNIPKSFVNTSVESNKKFTQYDSRLNWVGNTFQFLNGLTDAASNVISAGSHIIGLKMLMMVSNLHQHLVLCMLYLFYLLKIK